jgi:hypothetical protein
LSANYFAFQAGPTIALATCMLKLILMMNLFLHAEVNVKDASFFKTWSEKIFHRTYKSRSVHKGWLGTGWCTEFEKTLNVQGKEITLSDCSLDAEIKLSLGKDIYLIGSLYIYEISGSQLQKYDLRGRLVFLKIQDRKIEIKYGKNDEVREVIFNDKFKLTIATDSKKGKTARLQGPRMADFLYAINRNLNEVRQGTVSLYKYSYDEFDNMISVNSPRHHETMAYDAERDQITEYVSADGCLNQYTYLAVSPLHSATLRKKICGKKSEEIRYHFFYRIRGGQTFLTRATAEQSNRSFEQLFDDVTGLPRLSEKQEAL